MASVTDKMLPVLAGIKQAVVADIETTGRGTPKYEDITQISGVLVDFEAGKVLSKFNRYCKLMRRKKMPEDVSELTGITDQLLEEKGIKVDDALNEFFRFIDGKPVIFHNYAFDWTKFLKPEFERIGKVPSSPVICTYLVSRKLLSGVDDPPENFKLGTLVSYFGGTIQHAHNSYYDCVYTGAVARRLQKLVKNFQEEDDADLLAPGKNAVEVKPFDLGRLQIKSIAYWNRYKKERIYVTCNAGSIYYDIQMAAWQAKELFGGSVDWAGFEKIVLRVGQVDSMDQLITKYKERAERLSAHHAS